MKTLTLTTEQFDFALGLASDVGGAKHELARAEHLHSLASSTEKRRLYRDLYAARKRLTHCQKALEDMRRRIGAEDEQP